MFTTLADVRGSGRVRGKCFNCGEEGHWANACPLKKRKDADAAAGGGDAAPRRKRARDPAKKGASKENAKSVSSFAGKAMKLTAGDGAAPLASFNEAVDQQQRELDAVLMTAPAPSAGPQRRRQTGGAAEASGRAGGGARATAEEEVIDLCGDSDDDDVVPGRPDAGAQSRARVREARPPGAGRPRRPTPRLGIQDSNTSRGRADAAGAASDFFFSGYCAPAPSGDEEIRTHESVEAEDYKGGGRYHSCRAVLDTGNAGPTLITRELAIRVGIIEPGRPARDRYATPSLLPRTLEVRGVVAGATERLPMCTFAYRLRGRTMSTSAGITTAKLGCDVLVSLRDIREWEGRHGFRFRP